jgi:hypothetical protein
MAIRIIFRIFGIFYDHLVIFAFILVHFFPFWYHVPRKIWQPWRAGAAPSDFFFFSSGLRFVDVLNVLVRDGLRDDVTVASAHLKFIKKYIWVHAFIHFGGMGATSNRQ